MRLLPVHRVRRTDLWVVFAVVSALAFHLSYWAAVLFHGWFGKEPDLSQVLSGFQTLMFQKPVEQLRYLFFLLAWPSLFVFAMIGMEIYRRSARKSAAEQENQWVRAALGLNPYLLAVFFFGNLLFQEFFVHSYIGGRSPHLIFGFLAFVSSVYAVKRASIADSPVRVFIDRLSASTCAMIAAGAGFFQLLQTLFTERNFLLTPEGVRSHLPYTFGEFSAVAAGRVLNVDFHPQYQQFLPYLVSPIFRHFGVGITSYTFILATLSASVLAFAYLLLRRICEKPGMALFYFLCWLGFSFFPIETLGEARYGAFTYYAIGPLRLLGFFAVAYVTVRTATGRLCWFRQSACLFLSSLVFLNNLDFGAPALIGSVFVLLLFGKKPLQTGGAFVLGLASALLVFLAFPYFKSGQLPDFTAATEYLRAVQRTGYTSLPTPPFGNHWIFVLSFLACLALGVIGTWNARFEPSAQEAVESTRDKNLRAMRLFFGVAGSGAFAYYMNRSHWHVLVVVASIAFFPILLLLIPDLEKFTGVRRLIAISCIAAGLALFIKNTPNPLAQIVRLRSGDDSFLKAQDTRVDMIRSFAKPGEQVVISFPFGDWLAASSGVKNIFPYPLGGSMLLRSQLDFTTRMIADKKIQKLFGDLSPELLAWAEANGYKEVVRTGDFRVFTK